MRINPRSGKLAGRAAAKVCLALTLAGPAAGHAQSLDLAALEGNWVRIGSNYDPNDQMRIRIGRGQATLTRVPATVHASFRVGIALWMGIQSDGALRVRGSDGNYYPATLTLDGDVLTLAIDRSARGNDQQWRRAGPTVDGDWVRIAPGDATADGMRVLADQDQAAIRFLPADAPRPFRIGSRLWRDIGAGGAVQVLGSNGTYQPATIRLESDDRLWVDGAGPGAQLWVRPTLVAATRAEAARAAAAPAACLATALPIEATGLNTGWHLAIPDPVTAMAEGQGLLPYRGEASGRTYLVTDIERAAFPGIGRVFATVWQQARPRARTVEHRDLSAAEFASRSRSYRDDGYRATDIEVWSSAEGLRYAGVWVTNLEGIDWDVRHGLSSAEFGHLFQEKRDAGFRLIDIEIYEVGGGHQYAGIWHRSCDNTNWREVRGLTREDYQRRADSLDVLGFRIIDFESYRTGSGQRYAAIWERIPDVAWAVRTDRTLPQYLNDHRRYTDLGFRLVDFESYETAAGVRYGGVWAEHDARYRLAFRQELDDSVVAYRERYSLPGISVAIIRDGEVIYRRGFGWADSARGKEAHSGTVYPIASISKVIAGTLAARLEARGVVDLTRPTRTYVDSLPASHTHTLEQLLAKTGCTAHYPESTTPPEQYYRWRLPAVRSIQDTVMLPNCTPGQRWHYSTHGYTLVGAALEAATGKDIVQLIDEEIARPLELWSLRAQEPSEPHSRPRSYDQSEPYRRDTTSTPPAVAVVSRHEDASWKVLGGGLQANAVDLARFGWAVPAGEVVSDSVRDNRLWRNLTRDLRRWSDTTRSARSTGLGWELTVDTVRNFSVAEHGGVTPTGARSHLKVYRRARLVVAVLSNQREGGPGRTSHPLDSLADALSAIVFAAPRP